MMGEARKGIRFVFCTDTRPCETLYKYTEGVDLAILEGMYAEEEKIPQAMKNRHMLYREAAEIARDAGAVKLVLTHYSTSMDEPEFAIGAATAVFPETIAGQDGMIITMRYPRKLEPAGIEIAVREDWFKQERGNASPVLLQRSI